MESGNIMIPQLELPVDGMKKYMYEQLWKLCAGPMCDLPKPGEQVYYIPQGHIQFVETFAKEEVNQIHTNFGLPSKLRCRVIDTKLKVEKHTDEIYAEITLMPDTTQVEISTQNANHNGPIIHSFTKILTVSDTNSPGVFIPKRHVSQCLPPLDMSQHVPTQELVIKDIHDNEWIFKHSFRGSPQRHLLTTGWSKFVTEKKVVAGDLFVLLGGENGELRIGIRRARHRERNISSSLISIESMIHGVVATAKHAFDNNCMFTIVYKPRGRQFVVSYNKFLDAMNNKFNIGSKFLMRFEADDFSEISYSGIITGVSNFSSIWKDSEWRSLQVEWDKPAPFLRPTTVSPWEIQHLESSSKIPKSIMIKNKRFRQTEIGSTSSYLTQGQEIGQPRLNCPTNVAELGNKDVMEDVMTPPSYLMSNSVQTPPKLDDQMVTLIQSKTTTNVNSITLMGVSIPIPSQIKDPKQVDSSEISKLSQDKKLGQFANLTSEIQTEEFSSSRRSIMVHKQGETVVRTLDLSVLNGYDQLIGKLEKLFDLKGQLQNHNQWKIVFEDNEGDIMLVGDYPWDEFSKIVKKTIICPKEEVKNLKVDNNLSN